MPPPPPHSNQQLPEEGSILEGRVSRIEAYGAFVDLNDFYRVRGLVHISQLANYKVDQVTDIVSLDDAVWVKCLEVSRETTDDGRTRTKVSLSLKDASQQDGADLGEQAERSNALTQQISRNLHSSIGMGFAQDPMAGKTSNNNRSSNNRLVLKHQPKQETVINGYALVDDDDSEPELPETQPQSQPKTSAQAPAPAATAAPMGRGRGATLPAWMTRQDGGPTKQPTANNDDDNGDDNKSLSSSSSSSRVNRSGKKKSKPKDRDKKSSRHHHHKEERRKKHHHKHDRKKRKHRSSRNESRSRSTSQSPPASRSKSSRRHHRKRHRRSDEEYSSLESSDNRDIHKTANKNANSNDEERATYSKKANFASVEEAERFIQQIEAKKKYAAGT